MTDQPTPGQSSTDQPGTGQLTSEERHVVEALATEAGRLDPSSTGLATIQRRISELPTPLEQARARRHRRTGVVAGVVALGLAAAATLFAVNGGLQQRAVTDPAQTPTSAPTTVDTRFDPSAPRTSWRIYRNATLGGKPALITEEVRATAPYEPRQALDSLFTTPPLDPRVGDPSYQPSTPDEVVKVASVKLGDDVIELDLDSVSPIRPYGTSDDTATARAWTQSWVRTLQEAYGSELPVRITRLGQPFRLFGYVDTSAPIKRDDALRVESATGVFLPRADEKVTSPVAITAELPNGEQHFTITELANQQTVFDETVEDRSGGVIGYRPDLPAGRYELEVVVRSLDSDRQRVLTQYGLEFTVVGPDPNPVPSPVTNPATQPVTVASVFFPAAKGGGLVEEQRAVTRPADALEAVLHRDPSSKAAQAGPLLPGSIVASVTGDADRVTVDFRDLGENSAANSVVRQRTDAIRRTLQASYGADVSVRYTLNGQTTGLYGRPGDDLADRPIDLPVTPAATYEAVTADPRTHAVMINGRTTSARTTLTWYLIDAISNETRFQGVATIDPTTRTYAFGLTVPAGSYLVELNQRTGDESGSVVLDVTA